MTGKGIIGSSAWWIFVVTIAFIGLGYLATWSTFNDAALAGFIGFLFALFMIIGIIFSFNRKTGKLDIFEMGEWGENSFGFTIGFLVWLVIGSIGGTTKSILSISENSLFASIASVLPERIQFIMNVIVIPLAEEIFWMFFIAGGTFAILTLLAKKYKFLKNVFVQIFIVSVVGGVSFAIFHVGKLFITFLLAAFIFRAIMIATVYGDIKADFIKKLEILVSFSVGAHVGNNLAAYGLTQASNIVFSNFWSVGWITFLFFLIMFISAGDFLIDKISGKGA